MVELLPPTSDEQQATDDRQVKVFYKKQGELVLYEKIFDTIICTLPTNACTNVEWKGFYSDSILPSKKLGDTLTAFRVLGNDNLFKMALQFDYRFWEDVELLRDGFAVVGG